LHFRFEAGSATKVAAIGYDGGMAGPGTYINLHERIDRLRPDQAQALVFLVDTMLPHPIPTPSPTRTSPENPSLSFIGIGKGPRDLGRNADKYLTGMGSDVL